jgi:FtsP/CotA-like multicopper oxidase with cupredoxin domain
MPLAILERGKTAVVRMINKTAWPHSMHFHGHHVREISHSSREPQRYWRDTVFMRPSETVTIAFKAHNPGNWMLHCHMLGHQRGGMSTWYEVV